MLKINSWHLWCYFTKTLSHKGAKKLFKLEKHSSVAIFMRLCFLEPTELPVWNFGLKRENFLGARKALHYFLDISNNVAQQR